MSQSNPVKSISIHDLFRFPESTGRGPVASMSHQIGVWRERYIGRKQLRSVHMRVLDDMGISRIDAMIEAKKPFWVE